MKWKNVYNESPSLVVEELLRNRNQKLLDYDELSSFIDDVSKAKHWIDNQFSSVLFSL